MTDLIHLLMVLAFASVWLMVGLDLVGRQSRDSKPRGPHLAAPPARRG